MLSVIRLFTSSMIGHEGERLMLPLKTVRSIMVLFLILTSLMVAVSFAPSARASTSITSMTPTSGEVGSTVYLQANITNADGPFEVRFDTAVRKSGSAVGSYVNTSFTVPEATAGNHTVMVLDQIAGQNATANFTITTSYSLKAEVPTAPKQLQEGGSVSIDANMTGSVAYTSYAVNITVTAPNSVSYTNLTTIFTSSVGSGNTMLTYPKDFSTGANTNFTGTYSVYFNGTLANEAFFIGLTNSSQYHRHQTVDVKAMYASGENVTITIQGNIIYTSTTAQADSSGLVHYVNSTILSEASIGTYTVTLISISNPTKKTAAPDVQSFTVPGYSVNITLLNLAGAPVPSIILKTTENGESISEKGKENGTVFLELEDGTYLCNATYSDVLVGQQALTITGELAFSLSCNLTSLNVIVMDEYATKLPEVKIYMIPGNQTLTTDINGTAEMGSMLPNVTYTLNVSRYGMLFKMNQTIQSPPSTAWYNLTIICPTMTLNINVTDARGRPVNDAAVEAQELLGGRYYSNTTTNGAVSLNLTFGKYTVMVLINGVTVNETTVSLNETSVNLPIVCSFYGFDVSVRAVDYFGQPIPNVNVTLQRSGWRDSRIAGGDGLATFGNTFGGDLNVTIRLAGQSEPSVVSSVSVDNSTPIEIKIGRYVLLAGMMVEASQLLAIVIVLIVVVLFLSVEVFRRRWRRPKENEV